MKRSPLRRGKPLERRTRLKPQSDKRRRNREPRMQATQCEVTPLLEELNPPGWAEFKRVWEGHPDAGKVDCHHIFGKRFARCEESWNKVAALRPAHEFVQSTRTGRLVCLIALERRGELESCRNEIREATGRDPIGLVSNDCENGVFAGRVLDAAQDLCERYGVRCLAGKVRCERCGIPKIPRYLTACRKCGKRVCRACHRGVFVCTDCRPPVRFVLLPEDGGYAES